MILCEFLFWWASFCPDIYIYEGVWGRAKDVEKFEVEEDN
jgi:hypothetical protein